MHGTSPGTNRNGYELRRRHTKLEPTRPGVDSRHTATRNMELSENLNPRPVADSISEMVELVLPNDANPLGALLGGRLMHWIDIAGALAAHRHSRSYVVTASTDHLDFLIPVRVGDLVIFKSSVNRVYRTSMEVGVKVWVESYFTGERRHVSSAYLTFVAMDRAWPQASGCARSFRKRRKKSAALRMRAAAARCAGWRPSAKPASPARG